MGFERLGGRQPSQWNSASPFASVDPCFQCDDTARCLDLGYCVKYGFDLMEAQMPFHIECVNQSRYCTHRFHDGAAFVARLNQITLPEIDDARRQQQAGWADKSMSALDIALVHKAKELDSIPARGRA